MRPTPKAGIMGIAPYVPGRARTEGFDRPLKLSANENPLGCSDAARVAYLAAASEMHLYPDANTSRLRAAIAQKFDLEPERLVFGAGSDEIFAMTAQAYLGQQDNAVQPQFGFAAWAIAVRATGAEMKSAAERDYVVDVDTILAAVDAHTRVVFIANPANPTGTWISFREIGRLHANLPSRVLLVLDGAYAECALGFDGYSDGLDWSRDKENVLVTRTFSKAHGLASLRIGWGFGPAHVISALDRIRLPFSVSRAGEVAAVAALGDDAFIQRSASVFAEGRVRLKTALDLLGVQTLPSAANFVTARFSNATAIDEALAQRGILIRNLTNYAMPNWLRISVGTAAQVESTIAAIGSVLSKRTN